MKLNFAESIGAKAKKKGLILSLIVVLTFFITIFFSSFKILTIKYILIGILPIFLFLNFFPNLLVYVLVLSFFINNDHIYFKLSSLIVVSSLISAFKPNNYFSGYLKTGKTVYLFLSLFIICILPSYLNSNDLSQSLWVSTQLLVFLISTFFLVHFFKEIKAIYNFVIAFVILCFFNALNVIYLTILSGKREFGFTGVIFVDYVCISILILTVLLIYNDTYKKKWIFGLLLVMTLGLLFTQTRSVIFALILTFITFFIFVSREKKIMEIFAKRINYGKIFFQILFSSIFLMLTILIINPVPLNRFSEISTNSEVKFENVEEFSSNTIITRALIWMTAFNAIKVHPYIGIGIYSFPFTSQLYSDLPDVLYKTYVEGLSPHITYLAILTETGLVGLIGFIILIWSIILYSYNSIYLSREKEEIVIALILFAIQLYIAFSMVITDSWLWGHQLVLWGVIISIHIAFRNSLSWTEN